MNFSEKCYQIIKEIPKGKVTTYKAIAEKLNSKGYRAVGRAMNKNPNDTNVYPCHRVISSNGMIGGYAHGTDAKIKRLSSEGVLIENNKIDLEKFGYNF
ncbi:MAG: MGMT family protein [Candidatus Pacearchaeota archaeon]